MAKIASMRRILDRSPSCPSSARPAGQSLPWTQRQRLRETVARRPAVSARAPSATDLIREAAEPLPEPDDPAFGAMFDRFAKARVVLLGEATHGTSEFYRAGADHPPADRTARIQYRGNRGRLARCGADRSLRPA
jgi:hypothetical protein